jgi:hypothetical protein
VRETFRYWLAFFAAFMGFIPEEGVVQGVTGASADLQVIYTEIIPKIMIIICGIQSIRSKVTHISAIFSPQIHVASYLHGTDSGSQSGTHDPNQDTARKQYHYWGAWPQMGEL